jgi:Uma2 family endonuclease
MTALLDLPEVRERVHTLSVEDYHRLGELGIVSKDAELLQGIVVTKMSKSPLHELVVQKLLRLLLAKVPNEFEVRREGPLTLRDSEPEPDISVVRGKPDDWLTAHPHSAHLVVEVAVTSATVDEVKARIYAEAGIAEYSIVRAETGLVDVYRDPSRGEYRSKMTLRASEILQCASLPSVKLVIAEILPARQ